MKLTNMIIKLLNAISSLIDISASLYHMIRDFVASTVKEIKGHFGKSKNE